MRKDIYREIVMEGHSLRLFWKGNFKKGKLVGHFRKGRKGTVHKLEFVPSFSIVIKPYTLAMTPITIYLIVFFL